MEFTIAKEANTIIVKPVGRLDSLTSPDFEREMEEYVRTPENNLLLDFNDLDYISSAGLRVVLNVAKVYRGIDWQFAACNMQDHIREVFEISGFDSFIKIYNSIGDFILAQGD